MTTAEIKEEIRKINRDFVIVKCMFSVFCLLYVSYVIFGG